VVNKRGLGPPWAMPSGIVLAGQRSWGPARTDSIKRAVGDLELVAILLPNQHNRGNWSASTKNEGRKVLRGDRTKK